MKLVQQHPVFLDNPIGAVKAHLEHMMAIKDKEATSRWGCLLLGTSAVSATEFQHACLVLILMKLRFGTIRYA